MKFSILCSCNLSNLAIDIECHGWKKIGTLIDWNKIVLCVENFQKIY